MLKQFQNAALAVENKKDNTALVEMFSIELKFTVDCLKFWFQRNLKQNELNEEQKDEFIRNTPKKTCCICDFPIKSLAEQGWFEHVCKAGYFFLENIFSAKEMYRMGISTFDIYFNKIRKILDSVNDFCELDDTIKQIKNIKIKGEDDKEVTRKK